MTVFGQDLYDDLHLVFIVWETVVEGDMFTMLLIISIHLDSLTDKAMIMIIMI